MRHRYRAFGLAIDSDLALPELRPGADSDPADVRIHFRRGESEPIDGHFAVDGARARFRFESIGYDVMAGSAITVTAPAAADRRDVRAWLLGSVMAALLAQRGRVALHGNLIALHDGGAAAFLGHSGEGKSTLAAFLAARGHAPLADDLCALDAGPPAGAFEGVARTKLWDDSVVRLGKVPAAFERVATDLAKRHVPFPDSDRPGDVAPVPLRAVYVLDTAEDGAVLEAVAGARAAALIVEHGFRWGIAERLCGGDWLFDQCRRLAESVPVWRLRRRWGWEAMAPAIALVEDQWRGWRKNNDDAATVGG